MKSAAFAFAEGRNLCDVKEVRGALREKSLLRQSGKLFAALVIATLVLTSNAVHAYADSAWSMGPPMAVKRYRHKATLLLDGRVLVTGGQTTGGTIVATAEIYDPATNSWTQQVPPMNVGRYYHTATLLGDGRVFISGGSRIGGKTMSAEIYDPKMNIWTPVANMSVVRSEHTAVRLSGDRILVAGGGLAEASAEIYDPPTNTWTSAGAMNHGRYGHSATLLSDGKVLQMFGAFLDPGGQNGFSRDGSIYDPLTATWSTTPNVINPGRHRHTATTLQNGLVLLAGGGYSGSGWPETITYNPVTQGWFNPNPLTEGRYSHAAALLTNGRALVMGGLHIVGGTGATIASAEAFDRSTSQWLFAGNLNTARLEHTATALGNDSVIVVGGNSSGAPNSTAALETTEIFRPLATGVACVAAGECDSGYCVDGVCCKVVACGAKDQCHDAGACQLGTGECSNPAKTDGSLCNDGTLCTPTDTCIAGVCVGANPVVCSAMDTCHDIGVCDAMTGACSNPVKMDGSSCDDGNGCTQTDTCSSGTCVGSNQVVCTAQDACHDAGTCDPATGSCSNPVRPEGTLCAAPECVNGTWQDASSCNATGTCLPNKTEACGPFECKLDGCDKGCATDADCPQALNECQAYWCKSGTPNTCTLKSLPDAAPCGPNGMNICLAGACFDNMSMSSSSGSGGASSGGGGFSGNGGMGGMNGAGGADSVGGTGGLGAPNASSSSDDVHLYAAGGGCSCNASTSTNMVGWPGFVGLVYAVRRLRRRFSRMS